MRQIEDVHCSAAFGVDKQKLDVALHARDFLADSIEQTNRVRRQDLRDRITLRRLVIKVESWLLDAPEAPSMDQAGLFDPQETLDRGLPL